MNTPVNHKLAFIRYVSFNIMGMLGLSCYILADTLFIAKGIGSNGLTALNLVLPVYSLINGLGLMLGMGGATRYSILRGRGEGAAANAVFTQTIVFALCIGIFFTLIGIFLPRQIATLLGADATTQQLATEYIQTILCFSVAFFLNNVILCFVRNDNSPNLSMLGMLAGSFLNIVLDYVFIFPLRLGMFGAAFATGIAPVISLCILSLHWRKSEHTLHFVPTQLKISLLLRICAIGFSSFITEFSSGIVILMFNFTILPLTGNLGVAAYGVVANLALIVVAVYTGVAQGIQPLISEQSGRGNQRGIKQIYRWAVYLCLGIGTVLYITSLCCTQWLVAMFNPQQDPILGFMAAEGIRIYFAAFVIMGVNITTASLFASTAKPQTSFFLSILRGLVAVIPLVPILAHFFGMQGVWSVIPCVELLTLLASLPFVVRFCRYCEPEQIVQSNDDCH